MTRIEDSDTPFIIIRLCCYHHYQLHIYLYNLPHTLSLALIFKWGASRQWTIINPNSSEIYKKSTYMFIPKIQCLFLLLFSHHDQWPSLTMNSEGEESSLGSHNTGITTHQAVLSRLQAVVRWTPLLIWVITCENGLATYKSYPILVSKIFTF